MKNLDLNKITIGLIVLLSIMAIALTIIIATIINAHGQEIHSFLTDVFSKFAQTKIYNIFM